MNDTYDDDDGFFVPLCANDRAKVTQLCDHLKYDNRSIVPLTYRHSHFPLRAFLCVR